MLPLIWNVFSQGDGSCEMDGGAPALRMVVATSVAKAMRIADAIHSRCLLGASEGAVILLRSNVNLLINLGYILGDEHPRERAGDFMCYGFRQQMKFLTTTEQRPPLDLTGAEDRLRACAKRWSDVTIKQRAERLVISNHYVCQAVPRMGPYSA